MPEADQVRALSRGLDILEFLGGAGPSGLHQIHLGTRLPKSSLRRLLATLVERRFVRVGLTDGMYRSNIATLQAVNPRDSVLIGRLVEVARPHLLELTQNVQWPVNLHFFVNGRMRVIESTHGRSPFGRPNGADVDVELNMFVAASGLAYLACLGKDEVLDIVSAVRHDEFACAERFGVTLKSLGATLDLVRKTGYATRMAPQLRKFD
ncbi:IclR family mhp operon transcriptional activator [Beijerinckia sp. GAS462]|nr:IclR family mhp operon transcriptional activator [Beijerinckia sp. GAS462]